jgi:hypothetical protein
MSSYNIEREIKDMQDKIDGLDGVISDLSCAVNSNLIADMQRVITEWAEYTRPCLEAFAASEAELPDELPVIKGDKMNCKDGTCGAYDCTLCDQEAADEYYDAQDKEMEHRGDQERDMR